MITKVRKTVVTAAAMAFSASLAGFALQSPAQADAANCSAKIESSTHTSALCTSGSGLFKATLRCVWHMPIGTPVYVWADGPWKNVGTRSHAYCPYISGWNKQSVVDYYSYAIDHG